jgi:hypothetical protein
MVLFPRRFKMAASIQKTFPAVAPAPHDRAWRADRLESRDGAAILTRTKIHFVAEIRLCLPVLRQ